MLQQQQSSETATTPSNGQTGDDIVTSISLQRVVTDPFVESDIFVTTQDFLIKLIIFIPIPILFVSCIYLIHNDRIENNIENISLMFWIFHVYVEIGWGIFLYYMIFFRTKFMRYFRSLHGRFDEYTPISMIYGIKEYPNTIVSSLSAIYQTKGTLYNIGGLLNSWTSTLTAMIIILLNWNNFCDKYNGVGSVTGYAAFVSKCAFAMANFFELNQKGSNKCNKYFVIVHYIGVNLYGANGMLPLIIVSDFNIWAIIFAIITYVITIVWFVLTYKCPQEHVEKSRVHKISLQLLFCEMTGWLFGCIGIIWYLYLII